MSQPSPIANRESAIGGAGSRLATGDPRLATRLYDAGLTPDVPVELHSNRRVLVSLTSRGALRVHQGYQAAPDEVIAAIARWARVGIHRKDRLEAQRILAAFPVHAHSPPTVLPSDRPTARPGDEEIFARLHELHDRFNQAHFGNALGRIRMALSSRMRRRLGEFRFSAAGMHEIVIGRRHLRRDGWQGVADTLLHEMVHQWQAETGRKLGHGTEFRRMLGQVSRGSGVGCGVSGTFPRSPAPDTRYPTPHTRTPTIFTRLSLEF